MNMRKVSNALYAKSLNKVTEKPLHKTAANKSRNMMFQFKKTCI